MRFLKYICSVERKPENGWTRKDDFVAPLSQQAKFGTESHLSVMEQATRCTCKSLLWGLPDRSC
jgi:hypothetical protein